VLSIGEMNMQEMPNVGRSRTLWIVVCVVVVVVAAVMIRAAYQAPKAADPAKAAAPAVPVVTTTVKEEDIPTYLSGIGTVTPLYAVTVKARVDGQLEKVMFSEGQDVAAGSVLAQIDPRPFQAQLELAQAQKARDSANSPTASPTSNATPRCGSRIPSHSRHWQRSRRPSTS
jgi:multidrug efflux system membrane fusion protein